jgi:hypothetical protein
MKFYVIKRSANSGRELLDEGTNVINISYRQGEFSAEDGGFFGGESSLAFD